MKFQRGNTNSRGGTKGNRGRPTDVERKAKRLATEFARRYVEDRLRPIMDAYISLACGQRSGNSRRKLDPATCRHAVERFIGPAPRTINLDLQDTVESFFEHVMMEEDTHENRDEEKS